MVFDGAAFDREDGPLGDRGLQWESDKDGHLGAGREVATRTLSLGEHRITLTATDSADLTNSSSITLKLLSGEAPKVPPEVEQRLKELHKEALPPPR